MYLVADIGGTKMRIAASDDLKAFEEPVIIDTPQLYDEGLAVLVKHGKELAKGAPIRGIVAGIAGTISADHRVPLSTPHLQWQGNALAADLERELGAKAHIENDVALCGLGEAVFGAGRGVAIMAYVTVSTGVNGVRIIDGTIDRSASGFEIGGQYLSYDPAKTMEQLISGTAVHEATGEHPRDLGKDWEGWNELANITAYGLYNTISHWSPERVVLGGSMMNEIGIPLGPIRETLSKINTKYPTMPEIVHSELGDIGGLWGGVARLRQTT